jgi:hypothetical protein
MSEKQTPVKAYTPLELAHLYKVNKRTLYGWLKPHSEKIGDRTGNFYTPKQVQQIFEAIGEP